MSDNMDEPTVESPNTSTPTAAHPGRAVVVKPPKPEPIGFVPDVTPEQNNVPATIKERHVGIATEAFNEEIQKVLKTPINPDDIEIRPDGLIFLPEIKYRKILNDAFGAGAWAIQRRQIQVDKVGNQVYFDGALFVHGRFVAESIGEQQYFPDGDMTYATAAEAAKSNCMMRCCKDLGIAWQLWNPQFIEEWKSKYAQSHWCSHKFNKSKDKYIWTRKGAKVPYPWVSAKDAAAAPPAAPEAPTEPKPAPKHAPDSKTQCRGFFAKWKNTVEFTDDINAGIDNLDNLPIDKHRDLYAAMVAIVKEYNAKQKAGG